MNILFNVYSALSRYAAVKGFVGDLQQKNTMTTFRLFKTYSPNRMRTHICCIEDRKELLQWHLDSWVQETKIKQLRIWRGRFNFEILFFWSVARILFQFSTDFDAGNEMMFVKMSRFLSLASEKRIFSINDIVLQHGTERYGNHRSEIAASSRKKLYMKYRVSQKYMTHFLSNKKLCKNVRKL